MKNDALNHFKEEMNKRGLFRKIQVCANLIPPPPGADGEALGNRHAEIGHLCQVGALAAQQLTHLCVALCEQVTILLTHADSSIYHYSCTEC